MDKLTGPDIQLHLNFRRPKQFFKYISRSLIMYTAFRSFMGGDSGGPQVFDLCPSYLFLESFLLALLVKS